MQSEGVTYLERIEALLQNPPCFEDLVSSMTDRFVEYTVEGGFSVGHGVLHDEDCAVQKLFVSGGAIFPGHTHTEYEYLIVIQGEGEFILDGERKPFKEKDCILIKPGQVHSWYYAKHTKMLCITIPASKGFPNGKG